MSSGIIGISLPLQIYKNHHFLTNAGVNKRNNLPPRVLEQPEGKCRYENSYPYPLKRNPSFITYYEFQQDPPGTLH